MAYCRWSSNDFQCDLYVFADVGGGYTTHVAGSRYVFKEPLPDAVPFDLEHLEESMERDAKISEMCETAQLQPIGLPLDGESFFNLDQEDTVALLQRLHKMGYRFPTDIIEDIRGDADE